MNINFVELSLSLPHLEWLLFLMLLFIDAVGLKSRNQQEEQNFHPGES